MPLDEPAVFHEPGFGRELARELRLVRHEHERARCRDVARDRFRRARRAARTSRTSSRSSGSSALVGSSNRSTLAPCASARTMATRCFCPPESSAGRARGSIAEPDESEELAGVPLGFGAGAIFRTQAWSEREVLEHGEVRKQVKLLKHHAPRARTGARARAAGACSAPRTLPRRFRCSRRRTLRGR